MIRKNETITAKYLNSIARLGRGENRGINVFSPIPYFGQRRPFQTSFYVNYVQKRVRAVMSAGVLILDVFGVEKLFKYETTEIEASFDECLMKSSTGRYFGTPTVKIPLFRTVKDFSIPYGIPSYVFGRHEGLRYPKELVVEERNHAILKTHSFVPNGAPTLNTFYTEEPFSGSGQSYAEIASIRDFVPEPSGYDYQRDQFFPAIALNLLKSCCLTALSTTSY